MTNSLKDSSKNVNSNIEVKSSDCVNFTSQMLGRDFEEYKKELKYNNTYALEFGNNNYIDILERNKEIYNMTFYGDEKTYSAEGRFVVEKDGKIIAHYDSIMIDVRYEKRPNVYQFLKNNYNIPEFLEYEPEKCYLNDTACLLKWEFQNGYLVINTMCYDEDWKLGKVLDYMFFSK